jgi:hypothetical protein
MFYVFKGIKSAVLAIILDTNKINAMTPHCCTALYKFPIGKIAKYYYNGP